MTDYLDLDTIYQLHTAGVEAGLDDPAARPLLLAGINRRYVAGLHRMDSPGDQLLSDLQEMRNVTLANGEVPLATWLVNAVYRLEIRQERTTFQSALEEVWAKREREHPRDQPPPGKQPGTEERIVQSYDLLPQGFLTGAIQVSASIARLTVRRYEHGDPQNAPGTELPLAYYGTGWMLGPGLLITNHHVVNARSESEPDAEPADLELQAKGTVVDFGYDADGMQPVEASVAALAAADKGLDYAVLELAAPADRAPLRLAPTTVIDDVAQNTRPVNIIQHPEGGPKSLGIRNNLIASFDQTDLRYFTDTMAGSSGSPVCADDWQVVALHKAWTYVTEGVQFQGKPTAWVNRGTRIDRIEEHLEQHSPDLWARVAP
jgi:endonuclease G, mitochondrial